MSEEAKERIGQLVSGMDESFLEDPYIQAIVEAAQNDRVAENHMMSLGWPSELASKVRRAVVLRDQYPQAWRELSQHKKGFAESALGEVLSPDKLLPGLVPNVERKKIFRLGGYEADRSRSYWPILIQELSISIEGKYYTSLDQDGYWDLWNGDTFEAQENGTLLKLDQRINCIHSKLDQDSKPKAAFLMTMREIRPCWQLRLVGPNPLVFNSFTMLKKGIFFPELWKTVRIMEPYVQRSRQDHGEGWDMVKVRIRTDIGPSLSTRKSPVALGTVLLTRSFPCLCHIRSQQDRKDFQRGLQVEMHVLCTIRPDFTLTLENPSADLITVKPYPCVDPASKPYLLPNNEELDSYANGDLQVALNKCLSDARVIRSRIESGTYTLVDVAGYDLLEDPPLRLLGKFF